jgi:hypothetical protein
VPRGGIGHKMAWGTFCGGAGGMQLSVLNLGFGGGYTTLYLSELADGVGHSLVVE